MKNIIQKLFILAPAFLGTCLPVPAQELRMTRITVDDGLPQNAVNCILQDRQGFMWFGTQDGLCRYDGYGFRTYYRNMQHPHSLSNNYIWDVYEDNEGIFWISSFGGGLTRFDPASETFRHFRREAGNENSLSNDNTFNVLREGNTIWVGTNDGICRLDIPGGRISRVLNRQDKNRKEAGNYVSRLVFQQPGTLWMNSDSGLTRLDTRTGKAVSFAKSPFGENTSLHSIQDIHLLHAKLLIITPDHLIELDMENKTEKILLRTQDIRPDSQLHFTRALLSEKGSYWIGSNRGLIRFNPHTGQTKLYMHDVSDPNSLPHNYILSLGRSNDGVLWIGTRDGLAKIEYETPAIRIIRREPGTENTLPHSTVKAILEDENNRVWIGTVDGLCLYDRNTGSYTVFKNRPGDNSSLSSNYILSLSKDKDGALWIGTRPGGLNRLLLLPGHPAASARFQRCGPTQANIQSILDDDTVLWLGTNGNGLIRFDKATGKTRSYTGPPDGKSPGHSHVYYLYKDRFGNYWLGTASGGLVLFDPSSGRFLYFRNHPENPNSLSNNIVLSIHEDQKRRLWVGTSGGLNKLKIPLEKQLFHRLKDAGDLHTKDLFQSYDRQQGFPNEVLYGILEDHKGVLWISTNKGLVTFSPEAEKVLRVYDKSDGMQNNEHNQNAFYRNKNGELYFGGTDGCSLFHPDSLKVNPHLPPVRITDFRLYNEPVPLKTGPLVRDGELQLETLPQYTKEIRLAWHHDVITFGFAALSYINPHKNRYRYKLEGFDKDWINASQNRQATYTDLDAGEYTFRVKAANNDGIWNEAGSSIRIIVQPPPWKTGYAYFLYGLLFVAGISLLIRLRIRSATRKIQFEATIAQAKAEEREHFRKKSAQDFHDEAGNKITKINLFTELAKAEAGNSEEIKKHLEKIEGNVRELSAGMRDFIWVMDVEKDRLFETVMRLKEFGDSMFGDAGVKFSVTGLQPGMHTLKLPMEIRRAIMQIFKEAMNNCLKYARAKEVVLSVSLDGTALEISLRDNGTGFDPQEPEHQKGYGMGIMKERAGKTGGRLEVISGKGKGTTVRFNYNIPQTGDGA